MKSIEDARIEEISKRLRDEMHNTRLKEGKCPVCGTEMLRTGGKS
ncbi:MAG: hypothetical protein QXP70_03270 [Methanomassiliicoccales archaeon]